MLLYSRGVPTLLSPEAKARSSPVVAVSDNESTAQQQMLMFYRRKSFLTYLSSLSIARYIKGSTIFYLILFIILGFFITLLVVYLLATPIDKTTSSVKYPYILSVKPALVNRGSSAQVILSSFLATDHKPIVMFAVTPDGNRHQAISNQSNNNIVTWTFPHDFGTSSTLIGNYTLLLVNRANSQPLTSLSLYIVDNPFLYSLSNFMLGKGVAIAVGIIIPIVTISYQMLSQENQDLARRRQDKADWMMKNMNYYLTLSADSGTVYRNFEKGKELDDQEPDYKKFDAENILINTIKFYRDYLEFGKNTGVYFFDDFRIEDFIAQLDARILNLTSNMLQDKYTTLSQFYNLKSEKDLKE